MHMCVYRLLYWGGRGPEEGAKCPVSLLIVHSFEACSFSEPGGSQTDETGSQKPSAIPLPPPPIKSGVAGICGEAWFFHGS